MEGDRVFIIGDIHGCLEILKRITDKLDWRPERDTLIFLGDYIDRGEDSKGVVDFILEILHSSSHVHCLMGNHEHIFLNYLDMIDYKTFFMNGGLETLRSYSLDKKSYREPLIPPEHISFFRSLKPCIELDEYYVVHAGFRPGVAIEDQSLDDQLWIREPFISSGYDFGKRVIFGHTPFHEPLIMDNKIGLDTGAVYGNKLSCLEIPEMIFHSMEA